MTDTDKIIQQILDGLVEDTETASMLFNKSKSTVKEWLKSHKSDNSTMALRRILLPLGAKIDKALGYQQVLEDYTFFLPVPKMREALQSFDECGSVKVTINRDDRGTDVQIEKRASDIGRVIKPGEPLMKSPEEEEIPQIATLGQLGDMAGWAQPPVGVTPTAPAPPAHIQVVESPPPQPVVKQNGSGRKVAILIATHRDFIPAVNYSIIGSYVHAAKNWGIENIRIAQEQNTNIGNARDMLATHFVNDLTECDWSFWMDSDNIVPIGLAGWFNKWTEREIPNEFAGIVAIDKLTSGPQKFVSAIYVTRDKRRILVNQLGLHPNGDRDRNLAAEIAAGPKNRRVEIDWLGFGCVAIHRDVFEGVMKCCPEIMPKEKGGTIRFFAPELKYNEDVAFCERAKKAGFKPFLDLGVWSAHCGRMAFMPQKQAAMKHKIL